MKMKCPCIEVIRKKYLLKQALLKRGSNEKANR